MFFLFVGSFYMYNVFKIMIFWYMYFCCIFCNIYGFVNIYVILYKLILLGKYKKLDVNLSLSWKLLYLFILLE